MKKAHITAGLSGWTSVAWDSWEDDGLFESKEMGEDWIKSELHLEIKELDESAISDSLKELLK